MSDLSPLGLEIEPEDFKNFEFADDGFSEQSDPEIGRAADGFSEALEFSDCSDKDDSPAVRVITLNVAGKLYRTTLMTLTTSNSKLKKLFSGRKIEVPRMEDGSYFI